MYKKIYGGVTKKKSKYNASKTEVNGIKFDSKKEAKRYEELLSMQEKGMISDLQLQVKYTLIPSQYGEINGKNKCLERSCDYIADFVYCNENGEKIVEDVKGFRMGGAYSVFTIKRKLMLWVHHIRIKEV